MININKSILCAAILISTIHISCGANFDHKDNDPSVDETENAIYLCHSLQNFSSCRINY